MEKFRWARRPPVAEGIRVTQDNLAEAQQYVNVQGGVLVPLPDGTGVEFQMFFPVVVHWGDFILFDPQYGWTIGPREVIEQTYEFMDSTGGSSPDDPLPEPDPEPEPGNEPEPTPEEEP